MTKRERIAELYSDTILWDGFDDAIIGITDSMRAVYDIYKIECIVYEKGKEDGLTFEDAVEYVEFNMLCAWMGDFTPVHIYTFNKKLDELDD
jgi:hypothetical protein